MATPFGAKRRRMRMLEVAGRGALDGVTFGLADDAAGVFDKDLAATMRADSARAQRERPGVYAAAGIAASALTPLPVFGAGRAARALRSVRRPPPGVVGDRVSGGRLERGVDEALDSFDYRVGGSADHAGDTTGAFVHGKTALGGLFGAPIGMAASSDNGGPIDAPAPLLMFPGMAAGAALGGGWALGRAGLGALKDGIAAAMKIAPRSGRGFEAAKMNAVRDLKQRTRGQTDELVQREAWELEDLIWRARSRDELYAALAQRQGMRDVTPGAPALLAAP